MNVFLKSVIIFSILGYISSQETCGTNTWLYSCSLTVANNCNGPFEISNQELFNCIQGSIFWSYPLSNMTVTFTRNAQASEAFKLLVYDSQFKMPLYRILDGQEILLKTKNVTQSLMSDSKNAVVLKLLGPNRLQWYGEQIDYKIVSV